MLLKRYILILNGLSLINKSFQAKTLFLVKININKQNNNKYYMKIDLFFIIF